ncbi:hypothetical protein ACTM9N_02985 [Lachnospiraceae bacterium HCP1S3_A8]
MKTQLLASITIFSILAFPINSLAAQIKPLPQVCSVGNCQIAGEYIHNSKEHGNCIISSNSPKCVQNSRSSSYNSHH